MVMPGSDRSGMRGLFVTGTDTGVGKTRVATALVHALCASGVVVRVRKPVESGCIERAGERWPADGDALQRAAGSVEPLSTVCPLRLAAPLSPERAAAREGVSLTLDSLREACTAGVAADDFLLVEGAGGLLSPIAAQALNADLAVALGMPVLLVAADRLGTINHCLLTVEAIRARGLELAGIVLNTIIEPAEAGIDNAADLERWLGMPVQRFRGSAATDAEAWRAEAAQLASLAHNWRLRATT